MKWLRIIQNGLHFYGAFFILKNIFGEYFQDIYICDMKILIDPPLEVADHLTLLAKKKGWNRKQYINWLLISHSNSKSKLNK